MNKPDFRERLQQGRPLLADGAMGTLLHERSGRRIDSCFDELNLTHPNVVLGIHKDYIEAGSDLIETNTFGANRYKLAEHGLEGRLVEINQAAVALARQAVTESGRADVYVAGSVGPLGQRLRPYGRLSPEEAQAAFEEQITALAEAGADLLIMETFAEHSELLVAVAAARAAAPHLPIVTQVTFNSDNLTYTGYPPARVANALYQMGVDVIGVNCGSGPSQIAQILHIMRRAVPQAHLSAMPNAGFPEVIGGRAMYPAAAAYIGDYALTFREIGASLIGGCCGTTPAHIRAMREALDDAGRTTTEIHVLELNGGEHDAPPPLPPTTLAQRLSKGQFTVTVELAPPRSYTAEAQLQQACLLRDAGAHILNVADTPAARMKMSAWAMAHLLQAQIGIESVLHFPTRGRNLLRVQGDLLAAHALDLRNLFVVMGDPTRIGDYPDAMDAYDIVPSRLIEIIKGHMNAGTDMAGSSIGRSTSFFVGCALNMAADDPDHEIKVLRNKLAAGADFALGQAVFDPPRVAAFHKRYEELVGEPLRLPVLMGVIPLYSLRHAQFLHHEVPGISIPDAIFKRLEEAGENAPQEGVKIAAELMQQMRDMVQGAYVIPSYGRYELAAELVHAITSSVGQPA